MPERAWQDEYRARMRSAEDAAALIHPGDTLYTPIGGDAETLLHALLPRVIELNEPIKIRACSPRLAHDWFADDFAWLNIELGIEIFAGTVGRGALQSLRSDYTPNLFSTQFKIYDDRRGYVEPIDVFATACTPPDAEGYVDFGGLPWHKGDFVRRARTAILEVVPWLPRCRTTERVHVTEVTAFLETAILERPRLVRRDPPEEAVAVAGFVNQIIEDGDTIQIGAGRTATFVAAGGAFEGKHDLGWHSEITPSNVLPWMMDGTINSSRKTLDRGLAVTTSVNPDTPETDEWVANSGLIETRPVREVNAIPIIAAQERMCSINNAFQVDLTGQICSESRGTTVYNGTGGQPEFHIGAFIAPGGKAITVLPSTFEGGQRSRLVPLIDDGSFVTVPRSFADYVVTERGIARLAGKSQRQRAEELIAIAHPDHQAELRRARQRQFFPAGRAGMSESAAPVEIEARPTAAGD
jgi:4-hydroxybutyrate CoA-transferase